MTYFYELGTAGVTNGSKTITSVGAAIWLLTNVKKGDVFQTDEIPPFVIETDPVANADVAEGSVVNLVISNGQVNVPDVRNLSTSDAQAKVTAPEVGLTSSIAVQGGSCPAGKTQGTIVVEQSILPGLTPQGSAIILYVGCN